MAESNKMKEMPNKMKEMPVNKLMVQMTDDFIDGIAGGL